MKHLIASLLVLVAFFGVLGLALADSETEPGSIDGSSSGSAGGQSPPSTIIVGNDTDEYGCIGSAGYSWCKAKGKCIRRWEEGCFAVETETASGVSGAKTTVTKTYEDGTKQIAVTNAGRWELNKTVTVVNGTYKSVEIVTPQKTITVEIAGRGAADEVRNNVTLAKLSEEFGGYSEVGDVQLDPETNRVTARVHAENGTEQDTEIPETVRTVLRVNLQEKEVNISISGETKTINITTATMTLATANKAEVENGTLYIVTAKARKAVHILPENASEMAKLKAGFHVVKTVEIAESDGNVVYAIKGRQTGKILGIVQTAVDVSSDVDVGTGAVSNIRKPWWAFLVF